MTTTVTNRDRQTNGDVRTQSVQPTSFVPRFDVWENEEELLLYGDLPGVMPEDLDIRFEKGELTVYGKVHRRQEGRTFVAGEYGIGDFQRTFTIGETIDVDRIAAEMQNGVLTLHLPKSEKLKPRRIAVNAN